MAAWPTSTWAPTSRLGRQVAIKLLKSQLATDPAFRTRFRQEAQAAARMAHPTIVRVFDAGEESVRDAMGNQVLVPYIVMEYVEGRLLKDIVAEGPLDPNEAVRVTEGILTALEYSHRAGVVHRDIKPGNVMLTHTGQVKVMDFGIARAVSDSAATVAQTTAILGTAQYFTPEQARGETVDARTDLYSTGVVLFELLTGRPPFRGDTPVAVAYQHVSEPPVPPSVDQPRGLAGPRRRHAPRPREGPLRPLPERGRVPRRRRRRRCRPPPVRRQQTSATTTVVDTTLFGVNPRAAVGSEAALKELDSTDDEPPRPHPDPTAGRLDLGRHRASSSSSSWPSSSGSGDLSPVDPADQRRRRGADASPPSRTTTGRRRSSRSSSLVPQRVDITSDSVDDGDIIKTSPPWRAPRSPKDETISVYVSTGPATVSDARRLRQDRPTTPGASSPALGLPAGLRHQQDSPTDQPGTVISTTARAIGTSVEPGTTVDLVVSSGTVAVPDVTGKPVADAMSTLQTLGLDVQTVGDDTCTGNIVKSQDLPVGEQPQGSTITLTVCSGS